jgi:hypothetical protein
MARVRPLLQKSVSIATQMAWAEATGEETAVRSSSEMRSYNHDLTMASRATHSVSAGLAESVTTWSRTW